MTRQSWQPRGILQPERSAEKFQLTRYAPPPALADFIERYWLIEWDLRAEAPYVTETLPQPYVNLVFEAHQARIYGVASQKYTNVLAGQGRVFGVKFRPGAIFSRYGQPLATLTDGSLPVATLFGAAAEETGRQILAAGRPEAMCALVNELMLAHQPTLDEHAKRAAAMVTRIMVDRTMIRVSDVAAAFAVSRRTLQRIFHDYIGVTPKWVITRYRLHDAAEQLAATPDAKLVTVAQELGYFDQAHFVKEFKAAIGLSPSAYLRQLEYVG
jgi:AraC-like DNA-binding protein